MTLDAEMPEPATAGRRRLIQQALAESLLLAIAGGAIGVALGWLGLRGLLASQPGLLPRWVKFHLDTRFTLFALAVTGVATVLSSLGPAIAFSRLDMRGALAEAALKSSLSRGRRLAMNALVVGEIAVALLLLTGGGLILRAFTHQIGERRQQATRRTPTETRRFLREVKRQIGELGAMAGNLSDQ